MRTSGRSQGAGLSRSWGIRTARLTGMAWRRMIAGGGVLYTLDRDNNDILTAQFPDGSVATIGSGAGIAGTGMAYDDANDILYAMNSNGLYTVSTVTGNSNFIGPTGISNVGINIGLAYDEINRILYANTGNSGELYTLDVTTGSATLVGSNGVSGIDGLAWLDDCGVVATIPTLSEWGLIAMAGVLGIVGFMVIRRRKVTA
ncbi:MAG: IPTL-CTERM sorting domain-containing protein [Candidatus Dadabacteria bacterium]|nr:IPTL-CTERM sorting domain-containing protein [Candidatus Dadabacteria bacterium]